MPEGAIAVGFFGVLVALLLFLFSYSGSKPEPLSWVSSKSFDGKTLKMKGASSALLIFMTRLEECDLCAELKKELSEPAFLGMVDGWKKQKLLKVGKVKCWKNEELCRTFGIAGDAETAKGYPHILHFRGGEMVGDVDARTSAGLEAWVKEKKDAGEL